MVKKAFFFIAVCLLFLVLLMPYKPAQAESSNEIVIGSPPEDAGNKIASIGAWEGGWQLIEFWHYSGGYWKATIVTGEVKKQIIINDKETEKGNWGDADFLTQKICENGFVLEYKIKHPPEVLEALARGAKLTPVLNVDRSGINCPEEIDITITNLFNDEDLPYDLPADLPERPEFDIEDECLLIRALPKLNCEPNTSIKKVLPFYYPHAIPLVKPSFGSLSYAMYHYDGELTGVGYSPDSFYKGYHTIKYTSIENIDGHLKKGFPVTTQITPTRKDEPSDDLKIGHNTFAGAGAVSIRFWYPIRVDYYAKETVTPTPIVSPTPTPATTVTPSPSPSPVPTVAPEITDNTDTHEYSDMDADASCIIRADKRGKEQFNVDKGIPVRENLYTNIRTNEYLADYSFTEHTHTESIPVRIKRTYHLSWREDHGHYETEHCGSGIYYHVQGTWCTDSDGDGVNDSCPGHPYNGCRDTDGDGVDDDCPGHQRWISNWVDKSDTEVVYSEAHNVSRGYSYWTIDHFEAFVPDEATAQNAALPGGKLVLKPTGIPEPGMTLSHTPEQSSHVLNNPFSDAIANNIIVYDSTKGCYIVDQGNINLTSTGSRPEVPEIANYASLAENVVPQYVARNDRLIFNGETIIDDTLSQNGDTPDPRKIPEAGLCDENAFYKNQLQIPDATLNGTHNTSGEITYRRLAETVSPVRGETITIPFGSASSVTVHTPVVCSSGVYDQYKFDQSLNPDRSRAALILGRPARIRFLTTGEHLDIPGYNKNGTMDCRKYTRDRQVRFPFDVYIGTDQPLDACFVPKNTWYSVPLDESCDEMDLFIPTWVPEGDYSVEFREIAVNAPDMSHAEILANKDITNTIAIRNSPVRVMGRVYGFKITDVDDKLWREVFRVSNDSAEHTGIYYYTGTKNEDGKERGIEPIFTLPILEGSHPIHKNRGAIKTGYTFRFDLTTHGNYFGEEDYIRITPRFFYIRKDGTGLQEVDLWYHEDFNNKMYYFVKIEPAGRNRENPKSMILGDLKRNVPEEEINDTARILGMNRDSFWKGKRTIGWFDQIILSQYQRTFIGPKKVPAGVDADTALRSVQKWYGEYYLPNDLFVAPQGFDVLGYSKSHNGLDGKEGFWLKDGYIIVNFTIETIKNNDFDHPVLSYWGAEYCNMLQIEGFSHKKTDYNGVDFTLRDGDILFYDTDKRSTDDYRSGGTH